MANPTAPTEGSGLTLDLITDSVGTPRLKLAIGSNVVTGATNGGAWQGVASHQEAQTGYGFGSPTVLVAGRDSGSVVRGVSVAADGALITGGYSGSVLATEVSLTSNVRTALPPSKLANRKAVLIRADDTNALPVYIGGSAVTYIGGIPLSPGDAYDEDLGAADVYGIGGQTGSVVRVLEVS
jgi:hypothetical protein